MGGKRILILGIGNTLLCDEGFGVHALRYLRNNYTWPENVRLVDGGTLGLMLMAELLECDLAIILDIVLGDAQPGSMYLLDKGDFDKSLSLRQSMHQTCLEDVLVSCDLVGHRPEVMVFGLEPFDWQSASAEPSPAARALLPDFCARVVKELAAKNIVQTKMRDF